MRGDNNCFCKRNFFTSAFARDIIVIAAAGNSGDVGMDWPGAYQYVISFGSCGWTLEWRSDPGNDYSWWLDDVVEDLATVYFHGNQFHVYISDFSGREKSG